ncbi:BACON domain-containing protein [Porphyromonas macacae]|uniref:Bacteroidetes-Associated Carbohydrate-binding Often N-terminal n=1 Tax=Porphyromonas macacae TaxID=28115 RepID=A0A379DHY6_9PORP|nr:BACON domain-containing protein [Porphyromonas macacae]SUB77325.1 Bacteroidetes-Associated Carbohydrate-binding Often N-terminal [Porphyromonas macacae]
MKTVWNKILLLSALVLLVSSCKEKEDVQPALSLSEEELTFSHETSEKSISVNTDQSKWIAVSESGWIQTFKQENVLLVKVEANKNTEERAGYVKVLAGGRSSAVKVIQKGSDFFIRTDKQKLSVDNFGGVFPVTVLSNLKEWRIEGLTESWISVKSKVFNKEIEIKVDEYNGESPRVAIFTLSAVDGKVKTTITVEQSGVPEFILPCLVFGADPHTVKDFELKRRNYLTSVPDDLVNTDSWIYTTTYSKFSKIDYKVYDHKYMMARLIPKDPAFLQQPDAGGFISFLKAEGFLPVPGKDNVYSKVVDRFNVEAAVLPDVSKPDVRFTFEAIQARSYPTFETYPQYLFSFDGKEIEKYEKEKGGLFWKEKSTSTLWIYLGTDPWVSRTYAMVSRYVIHAFENIELALFQVEGVYFLTKEFKELMRKEGFEFETYDYPTRSYLFKNAGKNIRVKVSLGTHFKATDGRKALYFNYTRISKS